MSTINANVTPGFTWVFDSEGKFLLSLERLNLAGAPSVTVDLTDKVATADIQKDAVTTDKIDATFAARIPTAVATVSAEAANVVTVTIQAKDAQGTSLAERTIIECWLSDAAAGALTGTAPSGGVSATTGTIIKALTATTHLLAITDVSGVLVLKWTEAGVLTKYVNLRLGAKYVAGSAALIWA